MSDQSHRSIIMERPTTPASQMSNGVQLKPPSTSYRTLMAQLPSVYGNDNSSTVNIAANRIAPRNFRSEQQPNRVSSRFNSVPQPQLDSVHKLHQSGLMSRLKQNYSSLKLAKYKPTLQPLPPRKSDEAHNHQMPEKTYQNTISNQSTGFERHPQQSHKTPHLDKSSKQPTLHPIVEMPPLSHDQQTPLTSQGPTPRVQQTPAPPKLGAQNLIESKPFSTSQQNLSSTGRRDHQTPSRQNAQATQQLSRTTSEPNIRYRVQVNKKTYQILKKIGCGGSSKVYEGFDPQTLQTVAIKIINMALADPKAQESYHNERLLLDKLRKCNRVVRMYDSEYKSESKELILVMEKGDADLSQVIESYFEDQEDRMAIDYEFIKFHWKGMLRAVNEIHREGVVHADLKPVNFIVVKNKLKLIDFGIANSIEPDHTSVIRDYQIGTINYMAPEALKNRASESQQSNGKKTVIKYNAKADIWSLGCILFNMVYGRPPFDKYPNLLSKAQAIIDPDHKIEYGPVTNYHLLDCMKVSQKLSSYIF